MHSGTFEPCDLDLWPLEPKLKPRPVFPIHGVFLRWVCCSKKSTKQRASAPLSS